MTCPAHGASGMGITCTQSYAWQEGTPYTFLVQISLGANFVDYTLSIKDATFASTPYTTLATLRYGQSILTTFIGNFLEDFARTTAECSMKPVRSMNTGLVEIGLIDGTWVPIKNASFHFGDPNEESDPSKGGFGNRTTSCGLAYGGPSLTAAGWDFVSGDPTIETNPFVLDAANNINNVGGITARATNPSSLTYSTSPAVYYAGTPIANNLPSNSGGSITSYTITPQLPLGLNLDSNTGIISGTPNASIGAIPATNYTVTGANNLGTAKTTANLSITILPNAPAALSYQNNPAVYYTNSSSIINIPTYSGGQATAFSITPSLPNGLNLNTSTGVISGIPTTATPTTNYTVTAQNAVNSTNAIISLTVSNFPTIGRSCAVLNGGGAQIFDTNLGAWGSCQTAFCSSGNYILSNTCTPATPAMLNDPNFTAAFLKQKNCKEKYIDGMNNASGYPALITTAKNNLLADTQTYSTYLNANFNDSNVASYINLKGAMQAISYNIFSNPITQDTNAKNIDTCRLEYYLNYTDDELANYSANQNASNAGLMNTGISAGVVGGGNATYTFTGMSGLADLSIDFAINTAATFRGSESTYMQLQKTTIGNSKTDGGLQVWYDPIAKNQMLRANWSRYMATTEQDLNDRQVDLSQTAGYAALAAQYACTPQDPIYIGACIPTEAAVLFARTNLLSTYNDGNATIIDNAKNNLHPVIKPSINLLNFYLNIANSVRNLKMGSPLFIPNSNCTSLHLGTATASDIVDCYISVAEYFHGPANINIQYELGLLQEGLYRYDLNMLETTASGTWYRVTLTTPSQNPIIIGEILFPLMKQLTTGTMLAPLIGNQIIANDEVESAPDGVGYSHWSIESMYTLHRTVLPGTVTIEGWLLLDSQNKVHMRHGDYLELKAGEWAKDNNSVWQKISTVHTLGP